MDEMKAVYSMVIPMKSCSDSQKQGYLITLALAAGDVHNTSTYYHKLDSQVIPSRPFWLAAVVFG